MGLSCGLDSDQDGKGGTISYFSGMGGKAIFQALVDTSPHW
jgi:hypothetical protein